MGLIDIENSNGEFTWMNRRSGSQHIACRLDRFLVSETLMMDVLSMEASVLAISGSDHWPIQLWMDIASSPRKNIFQFEIFWLTHPDFQEHHHQWWEEVAISHGSLMYHFQQKLKFFKMHLKLWNKTTFGNIFHAQ
jgi:hypothetical protein